MGSWIGSAIGAVGDIFSTALTNRQQIKLMREQNEFNAQEAEKQRDWQEYMWNMENEYNSASSQRERLEEAGLNPYVMLNGGSAGIAGSAGQGATAQGANVPQLSKPNIAPYLTQISDQIYQKPIRDANVRKADADARRAEADAENAEADTDLKKQEYDRREIYRANWKELAELDLLNARIANRHNRYLADMDFIRFEQMYETWDSKVMADNADNLLRVDNADVQKTLNTLRVPQAVVGFLETCVSVSNLVKQGILTDAQAKEALATAYYMNALANGVTLDNTIKKETLDQTVDTILQELKARETRANEEIGARAGYYEDPSDVLSRVVSGESDPEVERLSEREKLDISLGKVLPRDNTDISPALDPYILERRFKSFPSKPQFKIDTDSIPFQRGYENYNRDVREQVSKIELNDADKELAKQLKITEEQMLNYKKAQAASDAFKNVAQGVSSFLPNRSIINSTSNSTSTSVNENWNHILK